MSSKDNLQREVLAALAEEKRRTHPDEETLVRFAEEQVSDTERLDIRVHLQICERCREIVECLAEPCDPALFGDGESVTQEVHAMLHRAAEQTSDQFTREPILFRRFRIPVPDANELGLGTEGGFSGPGVVVESQSSDREFDFSLDISNERCTLTVETHIPEYEDTIIRVRLNDMAGAHDVGLSRKSDRPVRIIGSLDLGAPLDVVSNDSFELEVWAASPSAFGDTAATGGVVTLPAHPLKKPLVRMAAAALVLIGLGATLWHGLTQRPPGSVELVEALASDSPFPADANWPLSVTPQMKRFAEEADVSEIRSAAFRLGVAVLDCQYAHEVPGGPLPSAEAALSRLNMAADDMSSALGSPDLTVPAGESDDRAMEIEVSARSWPQQARNAFNIGTMLEAWRLHLQIGQGVGVGDWAIWGKDLISRLRNLPESELLATDLNLLLPLSASTEDLSRALHATTRIKLLLSNPVNHRAWWLSQHKRVDSESDPRIADAEAVLQSLMHLSTRRGTPSAQLLVLDEDKTAAAALPDGTVLLSRGAVELCYENVEKATGQARLAWLVGHELAHLERGHTQSIENMAVADVQPFEHQQERDADFFGLVYMSIAGFDPSVITGENGLEFIAQWHRRNGTFSGLETVESERRIADLRETVSNLAGPFDLLRFSSRYAEIGDYGLAESLALEFLDQFDFPLPEINTFIGVLCLQSAIDDLNVLSGGREPSFRMPTINEMPALVAMIESLQRAERAERGDTSLPPVVTEQLQRAEAEFTTAIRNTNFHVPAHVNLAAVYFLRNDFKRAAAQIDVVRRHEPADPNGLVMDALIEWSKSGTTESGAKRSLALLEEALKIEPRHAPALYGRAAILDAVGRTGDAVRMWEAYLKEDETSFWAARARKKLNLPEFSDRSVITKETTLPVALPVTLGKIASVTSETTSLLSFRDGNMPCEILKNETEGNRWRALLLDEVVVAVDVVHIDGGNLGEWEAVLGPPYRRWQRARTETFSFGNVVVDVDDGQVVSVFVPNR